MNPEAVALLAINAIITALLASTRQSISRLEDDVKLMLQGHAQHSARLKELERRCHINHNGTD